MSSSPAKNGPPRAYTLVVEADGLTYIHNAGQRESRFGVQLYGGLEEKALEMLNNGSVSNPRLMHAAFKMMLCIW